MPDRTALERSLGAAGIAVNIDSVRPVGGGDIASAYRLEARNGPLFLKLMNARASDVLAAEAAGLAEIAGTGTLRTPAVIGAGVCEDQAWLALEWLDLRGLGRAAEAELGRRLAAMHRIEGSAHGWHRDNWIGRTPQRNSHSGSWVEFLATHRLGFQLQLAADNGYRGWLTREGARLCAELPRFFATYTPTPSLLHGDLWGGNAAEAGGVPVVFDPAVYYGDRETDIAMTRLFGGYGQAFYASYEDCWPLDAGYKQREPLYQLYHVLNHLNMFGSSYLARAESLVAQALDDT